MREVLGKHWGPLQRIWKVALEDHELRKLKDDFLYEHERECTESLKSLAEWRVFIEKTEKDKVAIETAKGKKKKDYSDLEREKEAVAYNRIRPKQNEKTEATDRNMEDLAIRLRPYWKQEENLKACLFVRYCNSHNLSDSQIEALELATWNKEFANGPVWGADHNEKGELTVAVKYLGATPIERDCTIYLTNREWCCMFPGCGNKTPTMLSGHSQAWGLPLCATHIDDYRAALKVKSFL